MIGIPLLLIEDRHHELNHRTAAWSLVVFTRWRSFRVGVYVLVLRLGSERRKEKVKRRVWNDAHGYACPGAGLMPSMSGQCKSCTSEPANAEHDIPVASFIISSTRAEVRVPQSNVLNACESVT